MSEDLYWRLHALSKEMESSGRIDEHTNPSAYATILDAMRAVRKPLTLKAEAERYRALRAWILELKEMIQEDKEKEQKP